ncbi:chaperone DnaJ [Gregarina niphandrodes]|uniref:Chaperone DnaJ n=1 Tax=Gregarina niphandrodes TaxID=110365 RepID=A0A023B307_GRENI|nr:chaperone DnaJ [Gregarina niphandrodes]EZG55292.1 chaperone DnaJ [Gregarina niphandrodes]|eukprot:XP_011131671.1 chaperone DnaJ [Gregarina niphandrodes]
MVGPLVGAEQFAEIFSGPISGAGGRRESVRGFRKVPALNMSLPQQQESVPGVASPDDCEHYALLGLERARCLEYTPQQLRRAYRKQALALHPDRCSAPNAAARFDGVKQALAFLLDEPRRREYDRAFLEARTRQAQRDAQAQIRQSLAQELLRKERQAERRQVERQQAGQRHAEQPVGTKRRDAQYADAQYEGEGGRKKRHKGDDLVDRGIHGVDRRVCRSGSSVPVDDFSDDEELFAALDERLKQQQKNSQSTTSQVTPKVVIPLDESPGASEPSSAGGEPATATVLIEDDSELIDLRSPESGSESASEDEKLLLQQLVNMIKRDKQP